MKALSLHGNHPGKASTLSPNTAESLLLEGVNFVPVVDPTMEDICRSLTEHIADKVSTIVECTNSPRHTPGTAAEVERVVEPPAKVHRKVKTEVCRYYNSGRCSKGEECTYIHQGEILLKKELCRHFKKGSCLKGKFCPYSHGEFVTLSLVLLFKIRLVC
jgi:hypothetical protein